MTTENINFFMYIYSSNGETLITDISNENNRIKWTGDTDDMIKDVSYNTVVPSSTEETLWSADGP